MTWIWVAFALIAVPLLFMLAVPAYRIPRWCFFAVFGCVAAGVYLTMVLLLAWTA